MAGFVSGDGKTGGVPKKPPTTQPKASSNEGKAPKALHLAYRPDQLEDVIGQDAIVKSLRATIKRGDVHSFLLIGPSGVGKTTIGRIIALDMGAQDGNGTMVEINAARYTKVDDMREVLDMIQYRPLGGDVRVIIVDECHMLSKSAWNSLLKSVEEPPSFVYWVFCTTEPARVPQTIKTRCSSFTLRPLDKKDLMEVLDYVCERARIKLANGVADLCVKEAQGSARNLLVNIETSRNLNREEAAKALRSIVDNDPVITFCRFLLERNGVTWVKAMNLIEALGDESPESVRIVVCNYLGTALKGAKSDKDAISKLRILEAFSKPYNQSEGTAPLMLSVGMALFSD